MSTPRFKGPVTAKVYLIGRPMLVCGENLPAIELAGGKPNGFPDLADFTADHDLDSTTSDDNWEDGSQIAEIAGRMDYWSFDPDSRRPGGAEAYFKRIIQEQHTNILELSHWVFMFRCSQGVARELMRYRVNERSQTSTRYVDYSAMPMLEGPGHGYTRTDGWRLNYRQAFQEGYDQALARGLRGTSARKYARSIAAEHIPFGTVTWVMMAINVQSARHMIEQRATAHAHPEFRDMAVQLYRIFKAEAPLLFQDMEESVSVDNDPVVIKVTE